MDSSHRPLSIAPVLLSALTLAALGSIGCRRGAENLPAEDVLSAVQLHMQTFSFDTARNLLRQHASDFPEGHPQHPEFLYLKAMTLWHVVPPVPADVLAAADILADWADRYPEHPLHPQALLSLGRIHDLRDFAGDVTDYEKARAAYRRFLEDHPEHEQVGEAVLRLAMTHIKQTDNLEEMRKGVELLQSWHEEHPDSPYASLFALFLGNMYDQMLGRREMALHFYLQAYRLGFVNPGRAGVNTWRLVELAAERGLELAGASVEGGFMAWDLSVIDESLLRLAIEGCQVIITQFPRSGRGYEAIMLLRRIRETRPGLEFEIPELRIFEIKRNEGADA